MVVWRESGLAVAHGVAERLEASNQEGRDAQPVVLAKRSGNLLGVPTRAVEFQRAPVSRATPVHKRLSSTSPCSAAASRRCEPTLRLVAGARGRPRRARFSRTCSSTSAARFQAASPRYPRRSAGMTPRSADRVPGPWRRRAHSADMPVDRGQRLAPEHVGVGVPGGDLDGCVGGATEIDRYVRRLARAHRWRGALEAVELAVEIHRSRGGPDSTQGLQVFVGTGVAAVMVEVVAIAREVLVVTTTDYVQARRPLAELIQGSQLACRQRRCNHPGDRPGERQGAGWQRRRRN